jgi:uncharacterized protein
MRLGDARRGKLADNVVGFGRALRRAGLPIDAARIALAQEAAIAVGLDQKSDLRAALECTLVNQAGDRGVFGELFEAFFRDPEMANKLLAQMLPPAQGKAPQKNRRQRVSEALAPVKAAQDQQPRKDNAVRLDAAMTSSDLDRIKHADFNQLSGDEYALVQRLASRIAFRLPTYHARRTRLGKRGSQFDWPSYYREVAQFGIDALPSAMRVRRQVPLPLLILVDISGSMERYSRMMLSFLHAGTHRLRHRSVFAFGTRLSDLSLAFRQADADNMLAQASVAIGDFAGGTKLGASLATLRQAHARRFIGGRTLVLLVSDGLDTGEPGELAQELAWLKRHCASLLWLNPLLRFEGFAPTARGPALLHQYADQMLAVHNLERLEQLADSIEQLMNRHRRK